MIAYEYKVVPAPEKGVKAKGVKTSQGRFAVALEQVMNALGAEGWEYVRADMLPCEERAGLTGSATTYYNLLVFRRLVGVQAAERPEPAAPLAAPQPGTVPAAAQPAPPVHAMSEPAQTPATPTLHAGPRKGTGEAAAAAAAAALTAYRGSQTAPHQEANESDDDASR